MKKFIKENKKTILIVLGIVVVLFSILVYADNKEQQRLANERVAQMNIEFKQSMAKRTYELCMAQSYDTYSINWDNNCKIIGEKADCSLTNAQADRLAEGRDEDEKTCMDLYKLELGNI